jgi:8-hydroxy-5-deazaflavin:NADPH oxidoreductase
MARVGVIGSGVVGQTLARGFKSHRHDVRIGSRTPAKLAEFSSSSGIPAATFDEVARWADLVVLAVHGAAAEEAIGAAGADNLAGKVVIDTTNQFGAPPLPPEGETAAHFNAARMPGARYTKSFNTLTSAFQEEAAGRKGEERVVQWLCGDDPEAKEIVAGLIEDAGFVPVDLGGTADCAVMEAPRRDGAVYGEEYRAADAQAVVEAVRDGRSLPPTPRYKSVR